MLEAMLKTIIGSSILTLEEKTDFISKIVKAAQDKSIIVKPGFYLQTVQIPGTDDIALQLWCAKNDNDGKIYNCNTGLDIFDIIYFMHEEYERAECEKVQR